LAEWWSKGSTDRACNIESYRIIPFLLALCRAGVSDIVVVSQDLEEAYRVLRLAERESSEEESRILPCLGLHPERASLGKVIRYLSERSYTRNGWSQSRVGHLLWALCLAAQLPTILELIRHHGPSLACVGEIGGILLIFVSLSVMSHNLSNKVVVMVLGLDFSPHVLGFDDPESIKALQRHVFAEQVRLAKG